MLKREIHNNGVSAISAQSWVLSSRDLAKSSDISSFIDTVMLPVLGRIDAELRFKVTMALFEALSNAVLHGNLGIKTPDCRSDSAAKNLAMLKDQQLSNDILASRKVIIRMQCDVDNHLVFDVEDQGRGFDVDATLQNLGITDEGMAPMKQGQRQGLRMIYAACRHMQHLKSGSVIRMSFDLSS